MVLLLPTPLTWRTVCCRRAASAIALRGHPRTEKENRTGRGHYAGQIDTTKFLGRYATATGLSRSRDESPDLSTRPLRVTMLKLPSIS